MIIYYRYCQREANEKLASRARKPSASARKKQAMLGNSKVVNNTQNSQHMLKNSGLMRHHDLLSEFCERGRGSVL